MSSFLGDLSSQLSETYTAAIQLPRGSFAGPRDVDFDFILVC